MLQYFLLRSFLEKIITTFLLSRKIQSCFRWPAKYLSTHLDNFKTRFICMFKTPINGLPLFKSSKNGGPKSQTLGFKTRFLGLFQFNFKSNSVWKEGCMMLLRRLTDWPASRWTSPFACKGRWAGSVAVSQEAFSGSRQSMCFLSWTWPRIRTTLYPSGTPRTQ